LIRKFVIVQVGNKINSKIDSKINNLAVHEFRTNLTREKWTIWILSDRKCLLYVVD
jgi:hypothetical protein